MSVSFATKTWSGDYKKMLSGGIDRKWQALEYDFDSIDLYLNNGVPEGVNEAFVGRADRIVDVAKQAEEVMQFFNVTEDSLKGGYNYSIAELCAIYNAQGFDYICYVQGDCLPTTTGFVEDAIAALEEDERILVVSPGSQVNTWHEPLTGFDLFFSDQMWLARTKDLRVRDLMAGGPDIIEFPPHGGDSFEKKVAQYIRASGKVRKVLNNHFYLHEAY